MHRAESAGQLAWRLREIDSFIGAQDAWHGVHVSLGDHGKLWAILSEPQPIVGLPGGVAPMLLLSEAGFSESYRVGVLATVPAPGALPLLGLAALMCRRSRVRR